MHTRFRSVNTEAQSGFTKVKKHRIGDQKEDHALPQQSRSLNCSCHLDAAGRQWQTLAKHIYPILTLYRKEFG
jgi:hypothetical protein